MPYEYLTDLLDKALKSPAGLKIKTEDADALRRRLYVAMRYTRENGSDRFSALKLRISPGGEDILEIHKREEIPEEASDAS